MPEVEIILDPETGLPTITTVDLLEDYWADFLCFRRDAILSARNGDRLRTHRYLRAALFTFLNYLSGMANRWIHSNSVPDEDLSSRMALSDRLAEIADRFPSEAPPKVDVDFLTTLALGSRNSARGLACHFMPTHDRWRSRSCPSLPASSMKIIKILTLLGMILIPFKIRPGHGKSSSPTRNPIRSRSDDWSFVNTVARRSLECRF